MNGSYTSVACHGSGVSVGGIDFTSRPCAKKAITLASGELADGRLIVHRLSAFRDWLRFEALLDNPQLDWLALDFPFSLPHAFLTAIGWPTDWSLVMANLCKLTKPEYETLIQQYCDQQPTGSKYRFRPTDRLTRSSSPMKLFYPPVGKMLFEGATRLYKQPRLSVLPFREVQAPAAICVEGYPAMVARRFARQYKTEGKPDAFQALRRQILHAMAEPQALLAYGIKQLDIASGVREVCATDSTGDSLDAVFCCIQAAWASQAPNGGIPVDPCSAEGWIVDPACLTAVQ